MLRDPALTQTARRPPNSGTVFASSTSRVGSAARSLPSRRASENGSLTSSTEARISASARSRTRPESGPKTSTTGCAGLATKASAWWAFRATMLEVAAYVAVVPAKAGTLSHRAFDVAAVVPHREHTAHG